LAALFSTLLPFANFGSGGCETATGCGGQVNWMAEIAWQTFFGFRTTPEKLTSCGGVGSRVDGAATLYGCRYIYIRGV